MAKFNLSGGLGAGLFNEQSKALMKQNLEITEIPYEKLRVAEINTYSVSEIEGLSEMIDDVGLMQNLTVVPSEDSDTYDILSGQRRYLAIGLLLQQGKTRYEKVPCHIIDLDSIDLGVPIDRDILSTYVVASTNKYRTMTDADKLTMIRQFSQIYDAIKAAGGDRDNLKRRDYIAREVGNMSPRTVQTYLTVDKNAAPEAKEALDNGLIDIKGAAELASLPVEEQKKVLEEAPATDLNAEVIQEYKKKKDKDPSAPMSIKDMQPPVEDDSSEDSYTINTEDLKFVQKPPADLTSLLRVIAPGLVVDRKTKQKIEDIKKSMTKQYDSLSALLEKAIKKYENSAN